MSPPDTLAELLAFVLDPDLHLIVAVWALAVVSVGAGYLLGGDAWRERFSVWLDLGFGRKRHSGFLAEVALISYVILLVMLVEKLTPASNISQLFVKSWPFVPIAIVTTLVLVIRHEIRQVAAAYETHSARHARQLGMGYAPYTIFSTIIFCLFFVAAALVVDQFLADKAGFFERRAEIEAAYATLHGPGQTGRSAAAAMIDVERINGLLSTAIYSVTEQINTVLIVLYCVLAINLFIEFTPMRSAYAPDAVVWTHMVVALALLIVIAVAAFLYSTEYLGMIHRAIAELSLLEKQIAHDSWEGARRYYEVMTDLRGRQGFTGFILTMTTGRGGVAFFVTALQAIFSYLKKDQRDPAAGRMEQAA